MWPIGLGLGSVIPHPSAALWLSHLRCKRVQILFISELKKNNQAETIYLRLGLEPTCGDSNPAQSLLGTWTHEAGTRTQSKSCLGLEPMRLGLEPSQNPVWDLNWCGLDLNPAKTHGTWFQGLIKLRFLMSHHRKNSVRDRVIGKKWIYLERNTLHRQSVGHLRR